MKNNYFIIIYIISSFFITNYGYSQDYTIKFDKLIYKGKFCDLKKDGFDRSYIVIQNPDGTQNFASGGPYSVISKTWSLYGKVRIFTRDIFGANGYKIWEMELSSREMELNPNYKSNSYFYTDLLEYLGNPSNEPLNNGEVILFSYEKNVYIKLTNNGCYLGRVVKISAPKKLQITKTEKPIANNLKSKKKINKIFCAWCSKNVKYGSDFYFIAEAYYPNPTYMKRIGFLHNSPYNSKYYLEPFVNEYYESVFCSYGCAFKFGNSKGNIFAK